MIIYVALIALFGLLVRSLGLFHDMWFDEIWSYAMVSQMKSPLEIFSSLYDNNHFLNSFFIYFAGKDDPSHWFKYRLLSLACGMGTILITFFLTEKIHTSKTAKLMAPLLTALSFPLIVYSTEARGYGPVTFFAVFSLYSILKYFEKGKVCFLFAFQLSLVLGFYSHLSFIYISVGLLTAILINIIKRATSTKQLIYDLLKLFLIPSLIVLLSYIQFAIHPIAHAGAVQYPALSILNQLTSYLLGCPEGTYVSYVFMCVVLAAIFFEIYHFLKNHFEFGLFCMAALLAAVFHMAVARFEYTQFRHFICLYPFLIILLTSLLCRVINTWNRSKILTVIVVAMVLFGNMYHTFTFIRYGRGEYLKALEYIKENSSYSSITIASDDDFRNVLTLSFYSSFISGIKQIIYYSPASKYHQVATIPEWLGQYISNKGVKLVYIDDETLKHNGPEWFIVDTTAKSPAIFPDIKLNNLIEYRLKRSFLYSGDLSGFHWFIYQRQK